jgi:hypothetical protein
VSAANPHTKPDGTHRRDATQKVSHKKPPSTGGFFIGNDINVGPTTSQLLDTKLSQNLTQNVDLAKNL